MSKQYGNSNKYTGKPEVMKKHPGSDPAGTANEPFSAMATVDAKEHHLKTIKAMAAVPSHIKSMPITQNQAYKKQSHAVRPSGPIDSFPKMKADISPDTKTKLPKEPKGKY